MYNSYDASHQIPIGPRLAGSMSHANGWVHIYQWYFFHFRNLHMLLSKKTILNYLVPGTSATTY